MPALYSENPEVAKKMREFAVERLLAALDYLMAETKRRREAGDKELVAKLAEDCSEVGTLLRDTLRTLRGARYRSLEKHVKLSLQQLKTGREI